MSPQKLLIFDTHPIQYRSPVFRELTKLIPDLKVCYFSKSFSGDQWWLHEKSVAQSQNWQVPLTEGFTSETVGSSWSEIHQTLVKEQPEALLFYGYFLPVHWKLWILSLYHRIPLLFVGETQIRRSTGWRRVLKEFVLPLFFRGVSQVISIGNQSKEFYQSVGVEDSKVVEAKYCVDNAFFSKPEAKPSSEVFTILFVGRLFSRKRPEDLIALMLKLRDLPVKAIVAGNGPLEAELKEKAKHLSQIQFLGFQSQPEIKKLYHQCDLLFVPSEYETWGLVINEAMCAKTPALVTENCGAANDLVVPYKTGFVYPVGDITTAASMVMKCLSDKESFRRIGEAAYQRVSESYQPEQFAKKIQEAFLRSRGQFKSDGRAGLVVRS